MVYPSRRCSIPLASLEAVEAERCTALYGVPTMFIAELGPSRGSSVFDLSSLRTGDHGRLALPDRSDEALRRRNEHDTKSPSPTA